MPKNLHLISPQKMKFKFVLTFILRLVFEPVNDSTLTLTLWPLLTTSATLATRPSLRSSEMWTKPSHRFLNRKNKITNLKEKNLNRMWTEYYVVNDIFCF